MMNEKQIRERIESLEKQLDNEKLKLIKQFNTIVPGERQESKLYAEWLQIRITELKVVLNEN